MSEINSLNNANFYYVLTLSKQGSSYQLELSTPNGIEYNVWKSEQRDAVYDFINSGIYNTYPPLVQKAIADQLNNQVNSNTARNSSLFQNYISNTNTLYYAWLQQQNEPEPEPEPGPEPEPEPGPEPEPEIPTVDKIKNIFETDYTQEFNGQNVTATDKSEWTTWAQNYLQKYGITNPTNLGGEPHFEEGGANLGDQPQYGW